MEIALGFEVDPVEVRGGSREALAPPRQRALEGSRLRRGCAGCRGVGPGKRSRSQAAGTSPQRSARSSSQSTERGNAASTPSSGGSASVAINEARSPKTKTPSGTGRRG